MKRIAILGYGRMGHEVEKIILAENHLVSVIIDNEEDWNLKEKELLRSDVAIEFSTPSTVVENLKKCFQLNIPIVSGTTGWHHQLDEMLVDAHKSAGGFIYGSNFSIGANLFLMLNEKMAQWIAHLEQYDVEIEEIHHLMKKDAPSGTAITAAQLIISQLDRKNNWTLKSSSEFDEIKIIAKREGTTVGEHKVTYNSPEDCVKIMHEAHNRQGFARGAVKAALWLAENKGVHEFKDVFLELIK